MVNALIHVQVFNHVNSLTVAYNCNGIWLVWKRDS